MTACDFQTVPLGQGQAAWQEDLAGVPAVALAGTCRLGRSGPTRLFAQKTARQPWEGGWDTAGRAVSLFLWGWLLLCPSPALVLGRGCWRTFASPWAAAGRAGCAMNGRDQIHSTGVRDISTVLLLC